MHYPKLFTFGIILFLFGCTTQEDLEAIKAELGKTNTAIETLNSFYTNPVEFEVHNLMLEDESVTAAIRTSDNRLDGRDVYLDAMIVTKSGEIIIDSSFEAILLRDGIGQINTSLYLTDKDKSRIQPDKALQVEIKVIGWLEIHPANIVIK